VEHPAAMSYCTRISSIAFDATLQRLNRGKLACRGRAHHGVLVDFKHLLDDGRRRRRTPGASPSSRMSWKKPLTTTCARGIPSIEAMRRDGCRPYVSWVDFVGQNHDVCAAQHVLDGLKVLARHDGARGVEETAESTALCAG
jgi:hypothetical protein